MGRRRAGAGVPPFDLVVPSTVDEALATLRASDGVDTVVIAGGTDLLLDLDDGRISPARLVSLRRLPWRTLDWGEGGLTVGSTLPLRTLEDDPALRRRIPGLWQAVHAVGSVALRHRATLGGNLGRSAPASDLVPMLLALDAEVDLVGPGGARRLSVDRFVRSSRKTELGVGELIRSVRVDAAPRSAYLWQRVRPANDISQVAVAAAYSDRAGAWRIAVGGVPPRPVLLPDAAAVLEGSVPSAEQLARAGERAARDVAWVADRRASEAYRRSLVGTLLRRAVLSAARSGGPAA
jgi:aerobic carbon-monoxide dehydrogenase medium subunit